VGSTADYISTFLSSNQDAIARAFTRKGYMFIRQGECSPRFAYTCHHFLMMLFNSISNSTAVKFQDSFKLHSEGHNISSSALYPRLALFPKCSLASVRVLPNELVAR
jgi:hypothetical protein